MQITDVPTAARALQVAPVSVRRWLRRGLVHGFQLPGGRSREKVKCKITSLPEKDAVLIIAGKGEAPKTKGGPVEPKSLPGPKRETTMGTRKVDTSGLRYRTRCEVERDVQRAFHQEPDSHWKVHSDRLS